MEHDEFLQRVTSNIKAPNKDLEAKVNEFRGICSYLSGQYDEDDSYAELRKHIESYEQGREETNRLFYMALPPGVFIPVSQRLKKLCYPKKGVARIIVGLSLSETVCSNSPCFNDTIRLRNRLERIWKARGSYIGLLHPTGGKMKPSG